MYTVETSKGIKTFMHPVKSAGISIHTGIIEASNDYKYKVHQNARHAHIRCLSEKYRNNDIYTVIREPHSWYKSFYRFFIGVEGYLSWALNDLRGDGYIYPIEPDEFVRRMINLKDTFTKFPNKAVVFRNLLRSQANLHFVTGYFESDFSPKDKESMEQFNLSLYDWFINPMGEDTIYIPMKRLDIIENIFEIKIPHVNQTQGKVDFEFSPEVIELIKSTHKEYYDMIDSFDENNLKTFKQYRKENI